MKPRIIAALILVVLSVTSCQEIGRVKRVYHPEPTTATDTPTPPPTAAGGGLEYEKPTPDTAPYAPPPSFNPTPDTFIPIGGH